MAAAVRMAAGVLVYERNQRRWEAGLKRQLAPAVFVRPCKTAADVREQLQARPQSVVVVDLPSGGDVGPLLSHIVERRLASGLIAIVPDLSWDDESALREAGVTNLFPDAGSEESLARQCLRILHATDRHRPLEAR